MSSQRRKLTENAQTADVHGPGPRPAVELPIWRLNALAPRPVRKPVTCRRADDSTGTSSSAKRVLAPRTTPGCPHFSDNAVFRPQPLTCWWVRESSQASDFDYGITAAAKI